MPRDIRSPSSAGCSKYHHHTENTSNTAPAATAIKPADTPCDELAECSATVAAPMPSPRTMSVKRP